MRYQKLVRAYLQQHIIPQQCTLVNLDKSPKLTPQVLYKVPIAFSAHQSMPLTDGCLEAVDIVAFSETYGHDFILDHMEAYTVALELF